MQDRYAGDIGDYGKIGLLRAIRSSGLLIGVNWYKTEPTQQEYQSDGTFRQNDGKYRIPPDLAVCDLELADTLNRISQKEKRAVNDVENADLIPNAIYYADSITVGTREIWHNNALNTLASADIVFLDPDNGLLVKSVSKKSKQSVKYTFYKEVSDYIRRGQSVMIYNHRSRKRPEIYFGEIYGKLRSIDEIRDKTIKIITFPRYSVRDYFIICTNSDHSFKIQKALNRLVQSAWGEKKMCYLQENTIIDDDWSYCTKLNHP